MDVNVVVWVWMKEEAEVNTGNWCPSENVWSSEGACKCDDERKTACPHVVSTGSEVTRGYRRGIVRTDVRARHAQSACMHESDESQSEEVNLKRMCLHLWKGVNYLLRLHSLCFCCRSSLSVPSVRTSS